MGQKYTANIDIVFKTLGDEQIKSTINSMEHQINYLKNQTAKLLSFADTSTSFKNISNILTGWYKTLEKINNEYTEIKSIGDKDKFVEFIKKNLVELNNLEIGLRGVNKELNSGAFTDYSRKLSDIENKYSSLIQTIRNFANTKNCLLYTSPSPRD